MIIQELKPSKRVRGRWLAVLEDGTMLRVSEGEVLQFSLCAGRELTEEETERLLAAVRTGGLKDKALNLLAGRPMSRRELERKLEGWEADSEESAAICDRLEELGFLNDASYAEQVVRHYSAKGYGLRKLRDELYRRGSHGNCGMRLWIRRRIRRRLLMRFLLKSWETHRRRIDVRGSVHRTPWSDEATPGATSVRDCAAMVQRLILSSRYFPMRTSKKN